ncbi:hypothetical protein K474DRAFT_1665392 [Panus rudis PR-1116 ss-1]|nr:hypothetical protein K474DRAFT_1665392 [Panus rudis PR-1116 ss-1]
MDNSFWEALEKVHRDLEPLAIAANVIQGSSTRLDMVLLTWANLYHTYSHPQYDAQVRDGIHASLQKRWAKNADHDVFLMAVYLNPYICNSLFRRDNPLLTPLMLFSMAKRLGARMFRRDSLEDAPGFTEAFWDYHEGKREFSRGFMSLASFEQAYQADPDSNAIDTAKIWSRMDNGSFQGRNLFVKLALHISSIVPNSAGAERVFSQMGLMHTRVRNIWKNLRA